MLSRINPFRPLVMPGVAWAMSAIALGAQSDDSDLSTSLRLSADRVRSEQMEERVPRDPFGRSRSALDMDAITPSLRLEYGSARTSLLDPNVEYDGLSANERLERGLALDSAGTFYDAGLRFDAAQIGDVALVVRHGFRGTLDSPEVSGSPVESLRWSSLSGAGLEWRPTRDFFVSGSTLFNLDDDRATIAEITAELGMRITPDVSVSLGYRTLDSNFHAPSDAAEDLRDAAFAALRFRF